MGRQRALPRLLWGGLVVLDSVIQHPSVGKPDAIIFHIMFGAMQ